MSTEVTPAYLLFYDYYMCMIPTADHMDINDFEYYGIAMSGDPERDKAMATGFSTVTICPADMAQYVHDGVPLILIDPKDSVKIYKLIVQHLLNWRDFLDNPIGANRKPPLDGLMMFNQLAKLLTRKGRSYGLVDMVNEPTNNVGRTWSRVTTRSYDSRSVEHGDHIMQQILTLARERGYYVRHKDIMVEDEPADDLSTIDNRSWRGSM